MIQTGVLYRDFHLWEKRYHHMWKIAIIFHMCYEKANQLLMHHLLYLVNERQGILFLKCELS